MARGDAAASCEGDSRTAKSDENTRGQCCCGGLNDSRPRTGLALLYASVLFLLITQAISSYTLYSYTASVEQECVTSWRAPPPIPSTPLMPPMTVESVPRLQPPPESPLSRNSRQRRDVESNVVSPGIRDNLMSSTELPFGDGSSTNVIHARYHIPEAEVKRVCQETCRPGEKGDYGARGERGPKGDPGQNGRQGTRGEKGDRGERGSPGAKGDPGSTGLDGRDGVPGEPGLDGIPGRSGLDGIPGKDGTPGKDGRPGAPGRDGINGTDGRPGLPGVTGPQGPKGYQGLPGPRGPPGSPGIDGVPGTPGIQAYSYSIQGKHSSELLIPPSITGSDRRNRTVIVDEGKNVRLRCSATGQPRPDIEWRKSDGTVITIGSWQATSVYGYTLNLTHITRSNSGYYTCIANNGVPPAANQTFKIEVHFRPLIVIEQQAVCALNGTVATLECMVEAFPKGVSYWKGPDHMLIKNNEKYRMDTIESSGYRFIMRLNVSLTSPDDFGTYNCSVRNEIDGINEVTTGNITIYQLYARKPLAADTANDIAEANRNLKLFGPKPPEPVGLEDLCPPCQDFQKMKCREGSYALTLNLRSVPFGNGSYPGMANRSHDCQLYAVGKPVYHRNTDAIFGSWMRDSLPPTEEAAERYWVTLNRTDVLLEYANKTVYRNNVTTIEHKLPTHFKGNGHVIYNGSFYYAYAEKDRAYVARYHLKSKKYDSAMVPMANATSRTTLLYSTGHNILDFAVDDNGLWLIYGLYPSNNTVVMKLDPNTLQPHYMWNISLDHHRVGEMFIVCGVLYALDSAEDRDTNIRFALDLYKNDVLDVNVAFTNPFRRTTMLEYNHRFTELYTWDRGNQLTYLIRYHDIGYPHLKDDKGDQGSHA